MATFTKNQVEYFKSLVSNFLADNDNLYVGKTFNEFLLDEMEYGVKNCETLEEAQEFVVGIEAAREIIAAISK